MEYRSQLGEADMDHSLGESGLKLTYLRDRRAIEHIDWPSVLDDLLDADAPPNRCLWCDLDGMSHIVLAADRHTGRYMGVVGLIARGTTDSPSWLAIELALVRCGANGEGDIVLLRAMLAHLLARIVTLEGKPPSLVAPYAAPDLETALRGLATATNAGAHPPASGNVFDFQAASLACRVGRPILVLDFRALLEGALLRALRRMHCIRPLTLRPLTLRPVALPPLALPPLDQEPAAGGAGHKDNANKTAAQETGTVKKPRKLPSGRKSG